MKRFILLIGVIFAATVIVSAQTATPRVRQRQKNQDQRIEQGVKSGQVTRPETRKLARQQRKIQVQKKMAKSDGTVTPAERRKLNREQNRASRTIYRDKHNTQKKP